MNWKSIIHAKWFIPVASVLTVAVIASGVFASVNAWNSANLHGTGTITVTTTTVTPVASFSGTITSDTVSIGTVASGATLVNNGIATTTHTLGITNAAATNVANGNYGFTLNATAAEKTALTAYFAAAMAGNSTYITDIGYEINGTQPFFYLNISGSTVNVYDGFQYQLGSHTAPLVINDTYPVGVYTYTGTLTEANGAANLLVTVTLTVSEPFVWSINNVVVTGTPNIPLAFGDSTVGAGSSITATATLNVQDIGTTAINGWTPGTFVCPTNGTLWSLSVSPTSVAANGGTATLTFTLNGTAIAGAGSIDLSNVSCTLTPN